MHSAEFASVHFPKLRRFALQALSLLLIHIGAGESLAAQTVTTPVSLSVRAPAQQPGVSRVIEVIALNSDSLSVQYEFPKSLTGTLRSGQKTWAVELKPTKPISAFTILANHFLSVSYSFNLPTELGDELAALSINQVRDVSVAINASAPPATTQTLDEKTSLEQQEAVSLPAATGIDRTFTDRFGFHEPMYFLYGPKAPAAKFQFSFKYRLIGKKSEFGDSTPPYRGLYLAYTQRSLWDLDAKSSPFYDTSYMPEIFFEWLAPTPTNSDDVFRLLGLQTGVRHESNGKDGLDSRSLNIAYLRGGMLIGSLRDWHGIVAPRVFALIDNSDENRDITKYRGYGELQFILQHKDDTQLSLISRVGTYKGKGSIQADVTQPIRIPLINLETYLQLQYFYGYGESLLNYNQKSSVWRLGLGIVR